jgi:hypothetical protein
MTRMSKLKRIQAKARELARSGKFYGWRPIEFERRFEDGICLAEDIQEGPSRCDTAENWPQTNIRRARAGYEKLLHSKPAS